jgi:hypothetical protein
MAWVLVTLIAAIALIIAVCFKVLCDEELE